MKLRYKLPWTIAAVAFFLFCLLPLGSFLVGYFRPALVSSDVGLFNSFSLIFSVLDATEETAYLAIVRFVSGVFYLIFFGVCIKLFFSHIKSISQVWNAPKVTQRNAAFSSLVNQNQSILFYMVLFVYILSYFADVIFSQQSRFLWTLILLFFVITSVAKNLITSRKMGQNLDFLAKVSMSALILYRISDFIFTPVVQNFIMGCIVLSNQRGASARGVVYQVYSFFGEPIYFFVLSIFVLNIIFSYTDEENFAQEGYLYRRKKYTSLIVALIVLGVLRLLFRFYCLDIITPPAGEDAHLLINFVLKLLESSYKLLAEDIIPLLLLSIAGYLCNARSPRKK